MCARAPSAARGLRGAHWTAHRVLLRLGRTTFIPTVFARALRDTAATPQAHMPVTLRSEEKGTTPLRSKEISIYICIHILYIYIYYYIYDRSSESVRKRNESRRGARRLSRGRVELAMATRRDDDRYSSGDKAGAPRATPRAISLPPGRARDGDAAPGDDARRLDERRHAPAGRDKLASRRRRRVGRARESVAVGARADSVVLLFRV